MAHIKLGFETGGALDLFLALNRELRGRFPWETSLVASPPVPEIAGFLEGVRSWQAHGLDELPAWLAQAADPLELPALAPSEELRPGARLIGEALHAAAPELQPALAQWQGRREAAAVELEELLDLDRTEAPLREALGVPDVPLSLPVRLVPFAPYSPGAGFLMADGRPVSAYVDCRRFNGSTLADCTLTLVSWFMLAVLPGPRRIPAELARTLPGSTPYHRRMRALLAKVMVEFTAGRLVGRSDPDHRPCVDVLGSAWRYPRMYSVVERRWGAYLSGVVGRQQALAAMAEEMSARDPQWYVDHVDAASLAADFYALEAIAADGHRGARTRFARWVPRLALYFARQLDMIIGVELGHYERAVSDALPEPLAGFLHEVTEQSSQVAWARTRGRMGQAPALALAAEAFAGPGTEYGGALWAPVAELLRRYVEHEVSETVFVDQCFTMQHNNGSLFDKYLETEDMPRVLDAQASGDEETLIGHASEEVRTLWYAHRAERCRGHDPDWTGVGAERQVPVAESDHLSWTEATLQTAAPGTLGCGNSAPAEALSPAGTLPDGPAQRALRVRDRTLRKPITLSLDRYETATAVLHTSEGDVTLELWPQIAPYSVDNFVRLARGTRTWKDPRTQQEGTGGFFDGTAFFRRIPGFLVQGGDRTGTGHGGPGYRVPDEAPGRLAFDRPYLLAMANLGTGSAGSQFFVTLAPARHLDGRFTQFGEVADEVSRAVILRIAHAGTDPVVTSVTVRAR
ncbi:peptidylprolyl isomerase [Streptomyces bambusae]|uniref:peptidylprolyl isomerase n=1 Tax=Streptomyces bambusae TaxID=1550616 RepID=UPI001CFD7E21|nr:peptidylprolyl isomerase [Streptomyces bambusae]MCB5166991.1 peptidylprolyl isomerase [Streptomyces bambusae]